MEDAEEAVREGKRRRTSLQDCHDDEALPEDGNFGATLAGKGALPSRTAAPYDTVGGLEGCNEICRSDLL